MALAYVTTPLVGILLVLAVANAAPRENSREVKAPNSKRAFANGLMGPRADALRETMHRGYPNKPSVLWGRDVAAKDGLKNTETFEGGLQPGMWGKRAAGRPKLNMLWGRAAAESGPNNMGLWGRENGRPKVGLWGRSSMPRKVGLWGRQMQHSNLPEGPVKGLWGKEVEERSSEEEGRGSDELERELENKIISLFRQLKSTEKRREVIHGRAPNVGIWGK